MDDLEFPTKVAVSVVSYDRPKTLYVCLDSILRMHQVEKVPVFVFLIENDTLMDRLSMIGDLPVNKMVIRERGGDAYMSALRYLFYVVGCAYVMSLGDDNLVCSDTLDYALSLEEDSQVFVDSLGGYDAELGNTMCGASTMGGVYIKKDSFDLLHTWLNNGRCSQILGSSFVPGTGYRYDFDHFLDMLMKHGGLCTRYAPVRYIMCFGLYGLHTPEISVCREMEDNRFFVGDRHSWLSNVTKILASDEELPEIVTKILLPRHFIYR